MSNYPRPKNPLNVGDLIKLLATVPQDLPVCVGYDSMVCVDAPEAIMTVPEGDDRGLYIGAMGSDIECTGRYSKGKIMWKYTLTFEES